MKSDVAVDVLKVISTSGYCLNSILLDAGTFGPKAEHKSGKISTPNAFSLSSLTDVSMATVIVSSNLICLLSALTIE